MSAVSLTFHPDAHVYCWEGKPVPNVTRVLAPLTDYSHIAPNVLKRAQDEGKAVHKMVELDIGGTLDVASLPEWMAPHWRAWNRFKDDTGFVPYYSEWMSYHVVLGYAGTLDLCGELPKLKGVKGLALIDIKRSFYAGAAIGLQLAAYAELLKRDQDIPVAHRFALRFLQNGSYRLEPFDDPADYPTWVAALTMHKWRQKHGK